MRIEELVKSCPDYTKVTFLVETGEAVFYEWADAGDVLHFAERDSKGLTGASVTAIVLHRNRTASRNELALTTEREHP